MRHFASSRFLRVTFTLLTAAFAASAAEVSDLQWQSSGLQAMRGGYRPHSLSVSPEKPATLKQAPAGWPAPKYGVIEVGPAKAKTAYLVALEEIEGKPSRLIVDGNANGDLTDDPVHEWTARTYERPDGGTSVTYNSEATVQMPFAGTPRPAHLIFYTAASRNAVTKEERLAYGYYSDYGLVGTVKIGDQSVPALLEDAGITGQFRISADIGSTPLLHLDLNRNGKPDRGETVVVSRPFEAFGSWWAVTNLTPEGVFQIVASSKPPAPAKPAGPDLSPGQQAPAFTAKLTNGKTVNFPGDYQGKIVLLDFWATWCGPCVAEIPNVVRTYQKYHPQGLEVLGISLDRADWEQKLADFTQKKEMPWPQVYDGKFWSAEVAKLYGIHAIPHMLLVDGDTGRILADQDIRGEALAPAIEKGLAGRKK